MPSFSYSFSAATQQNLRTTYGPDHTEYVSKAEDLGQTPLDLDPYIKRELGQVMILAITDKRERQLSTRPAAESIVFT